MRPTPPGSRAAIATSPGTCGGSTDPRPPIGTTFALNDARQFFMGYRYGNFNYATRAPGGSVTIDGFTMTAP